MGIELLPGLLPVSSPGPWNWRSGGLQRERLVKPHLGGCLLTVGGGKVYNLMDYMSRGQMAPKVKKCVSLCAVTGRRR